MTNPVKTITIDQFKGTLVRDTTGKMNSGLAKYSTTFGNQPFANPGNLTWNEVAVQIDPSASVITDLIMCGKERIESGISYIYAVGHTGRVYKIQMNDPSSYNPNYDNPVLLTTITINTPTLTRGGSIDFYGTTERIYIGHDQGVTQLNFDGGGEAFVGSQGSWTQNVPRPIRQFVGSMFIGNGANLAQIDSTLTVITYTKLSPGFPDNTQVRDIDVSTDGNYLDIVVSRLALPNITTSAVDTTLQTNSESYIFRWNGTDAGYTAFTSFPSFSLNANQTFGNWQYTFGYDIAGTAVFNPINKILSPVLSQAPVPNAVNSNGNLVGWMTPEFVNGFLRVSLFNFGSLDDEVKVGWWRQFQQAAQGTETDVMRVPFSLIVSNLVIGSVTNGYPGGVSGSGKIYFSTLETSASPTTKYKFYKFFPVPTGAGVPLPGVYETQNELFSKKIKLSEIRIYTAPLISGNAYTISLIGSDGNPIPNSTKTFTAGTTNPLGADFQWYNPQMEPTYTIGVRITNVGTTNMIFYKIELDYVGGGK